MELLKRYENQVWELMDFVDYVDYTDYADHTESISLD